MNELKAQKIKNDYTKVEDSIGSSTDYKGLKTLANNIRVRITKDADYKHFVRLADNAEHKSRILRIREKCPSPFNQSLVEQIAFNNFVEGTASFDRLPSPRVIHQQLNVYGYSKTLAKHCEKEVGNVVFFKMFAKGIVKHTAEYFIYQHGKDLVSSKVYEKIENLFLSSDELLLEVA